MGIPAYFRTLTRKFPDIITQFVPGQQVDNLYIDANSMIHPCAQKVLQSYKGRNQPGLPELHDRISRQFCEYVQELAVDVNPRDLLYISVDGPAPRAKIHQQRQRRYKSGKLSRLSDEIYRELGLKDHVSIFDTNAITPGTTFMSDLAKVVAEEFNAKRDYSVVFSSSNTPGEGEHKIMSHLRGSTNKHKISYVYGLDADLIFLCMCLPHPRVSLIRERVYFGEKDNQPESADGKVVFDILSIQDLKEAFFVDSKQRTNCVFDRNKIIADYVFFCFLLGNDFLPHVPGLSIPTGGHEILQKHYYSILRNSDKHLVLHDGKINTGFFKKLLSSLAADEDKILAEQTTRRQHFRYSSPYLPNPALSAAENKHNKTMHEFGIVYKSQDDTVGMGRRGWKWRYYMKYCGVEPAVRPAEYDRVRKSMANQYMTGLIWTLNYYSGDLTDWRWHYPYDVAPTLTDLVEFFSDFDTITLTKSKPFKPFEQLMLVLPPQSAELLPKSYQTLLTQVDSPVSHLYPSDFRVHTLDKIHYSEAMPRLPVILETDILTAVKSLRLTPAEKDRNVLSKGDTKYSVV